MPYTFSVLLHSPFAVPVSKEEYPLDGSNTASALQQSDLVFDCVLAIITQYSVSDINLQLQKDQWCSADLQDPD